MLLAAGDTGITVRLERELVRTGISVSVWRPDDPSPDVPPGGFHLVVVDADDGRDFQAEAARFVRESFADATVIAIASDPTREQLLGLLETGVDKLIQKPVDPFELAGYVREACQRAVIRRFSAEIIGRLKNSDARLERNQIEMHDAIVRSNEELQSVNQRLYTVVSQLKTLYYMGRDLAENENWSDALDRFLMALVSFMNAEGAALLLFSRNNSVLAPRASFQIGDELIAGTCAQILSKWKQHTRSTEIHSLESYGSGKYISCLESTAHWKNTVIPLRHRNRPVGFILLEKDYKDGYDFKGDYDFLNTLQTIFVEEIANASYISELRHLGRFNSKVLDNIRSGVITTDAKGTVNYSNEWATGICPDLRDSTTKPLHFDDLFKSRTYGEGFYNSLMESGKNSHVSEVECLGGRGEGFPARLRTAKMYDDNLDGMVLVAIFEDLTDQKRMETEIRRNDRLRVLGQLSANVAHEIRNPLTGIATSAEVLGGKLGQDDENSKYITVILDEIHRLNGIIRNLLDFARPPKPQISSCSTEEIIDRVISLLGDEAAKRGVKLEKRGEVAIPDCEADGAQITQVIMNVVLNAVQACHEGDEVILDVKSEKATESSSARVVRIDVLDSGPGVPKEIRKNFFDPFVTAKARGTGLGLAISQQIVEEHNGTIECAFLDKGTKFSIRIPQREMENEKQRNQEGQRGK